MWQKRTIGSLLVISVLLLVAAIPMLAQDTPTPQPYVGAPASGTWQGAAYFGSSVEQLAAPLSFNLDASGVVAGRIRFDFQYPGMTENLMALMNEHGCVITFDNITPEGEPVTGYFMDNGRAVGTFSMSACYLEGYGELTFGSPISGVWYAEQTGVTTAFNVQPPTVAPTDAPQTADSPPTDTDDTTASGDAAYDPEQMAMGVQVYRSFCAECHGEFGEGGEGVADLTSDTVQNMTDERIMEVINLGVEGTEMEPWERLLTEQEKQAVLLLIRNPEVLHER